MIGGSAAERCSLPAIAVEQLTHLFGNLRVFEDDVLGLEEIALEIIELGSRCAGLHFAILDVAVLPLCIAQGRRNEATSIIVFRIVKLLIRFGFMAAKRKPTIAARMCRTEIIGFPLIYRP